MRAVKVHIDAIGAAGFNYDEPIEAAWLAEALGQQTHLRAEAPGHLQVHLERLGEAVHARGRLHVALVSQCSRCLEPVQLPVNVPIEVTLFPRGGEPAAPDPEGELSPEDVGISTYENDEVDLAAIVRDEVFLELPMNPLCASTCAGLCPQCGANRNQVACACAPPIDPRWHALQSFRESAKG